MPKKRTGGEIRRTVEEWREQSGWGMHEDTLETFDQCVDEAIALRSVVGHVEDDADYCADDCPGCTDPIASLKARLASLEAERVRARPEVVAFARQMESALRGHDEDRGLQGWKGASLGRLHEEWLGKYLHRLTEALSAADGREIERQSVNAANVLMMLADVAAEALR